MNTSHEQRLRQVFDQACVLRRDDRAAFLTEACRDEPGLRERVEALLAYDDSGSGPFDTPLVADDGRQAIANCIDCAWEQHLPESLGRYRVVREIGRGSMGIVFEAELETPRRSVAVKVLRPGVSTGDMLRRFQFEAQVLRQLDHPSVARFYDAGTTDTGHGPQPYFAMELVDGRPLHLYACESDLSSRQRLDLLARICDAVHHAHTKGIVHRDLKPGNILIDASGGPRVLDFGVARATGATACERTQVTAAGQLIGTLRYMSPEQATGRPDDVDTRSDIYALGVIGYELLADRAPYELDEATIPEAVRRICETEPAPLSAFDRAFRGDIETIVAKALAKDRDRRYASASDLAADIRRYLHDEPIIARPPSLLYQLGKYARRNRGAFSSAIAAVLILIVGAAGTGIGFVRASRQRELALQREQEAIAAREDADAQRTLAEQRLHEAEEARDNSDQVLKFIKKILTLATPDKEGRQLLLTDALVKASGMISSAFVDKPRLAAELRNTVAYIYWQLGDLKTARKHVKLALGVRRAALGETHPETLSMQNNLAVLYEEAGELNEAAQVLEEILAVHRTANTDGTPSALATMVNLANTYTKLGRYEEANSLFKTTVETCRRTLGSRHRTTLSIRNNFAYFLAKRRAFDEAEPMLLDLLATSRAILGEEHTFTLTVRGNLAYLYGNQNRWAEGEPIVRELLETQRRVLGEEHPETLTILHNLAVFEQGLGHFEQAAALYETAIHARSRTLGDEHPDTIGTMQNLASLQNELGRYAEAEVLLHQVLNVRRRTLGDEHPNTISAITSLAVAYRHLERLPDAEMLAEEAYYHASVAHGPGDATTLTAANNLALVYQDLGLFEPAEKLQVATLAARRRVLGSEHESTIASMCNLADLYIKSERIAEAAGLLEEGIAAADGALPDGHWLRGTLLTKKGECVRRLCGPALAEPLLLEAYQRLASALGPQHKRTQSAAEALADLYQDLDRAKDSTAWLARTGGGE